MSASPSVLFRCDGSPEIGLGHVVRCLALADELRESYCCQVSFAMRRGLLGFDLVRSKGYSVLVSDEDAGLFDYAQWLDQAMEDAKARVLVLDVRDNLSQSIVEAVREQGVLVAVLDTPCEYRLAADLAFYPPVPQVGQMDWTGFAGQLFVGWEWVLLRREFGHRLAKDFNERPVVLVTMGGSDPAGLTLKAVEALDLLDDDFETDLLLGPAFRHCEALMNLLAGMRRSYSIKQNIIDLPGLMARADLAVASFGVTAYELAAMGVPAIYLCLSEDHAQSATAFTDLGIAISVGVHINSISQDLASAVRGLLRNKDLRQLMARRAESCVDGWGARRIAEILMMRTRRLGLEEQEG